jgi:hypothetical protein
MNTINYSTLAIEAKNAARDILRTEQVLEIQHRKHNIESTIKNLTLEKEYAQKEIARAHYKIKQAEVTDNPDADQIKKEQEETIKYQETQIKRRNEAIESRLIDLSELDKHIDDVQNGKFKVCYDSMVNLAKTLIVKQIEDNFILENFDKIQEPTVELPL